jgi:modulator of FtsH protease
VRGGSEDHALITQEAFMNEQSNTVLAGYGGSLTATSNRVLRNTYWLLALSLVPTVLGAWVGVSTGIMASLGNGLSMAVFLIGAMGLIFAIEKTKDSSTGVWVLLAFTFFMGLMLSRLLAMVLGFKNGSSLIMMAFGGTAAVFFSMASLSTVIKRDLSGMGKFLFVGVILLLVAGLINLFVQSSALMVTLSVLAIGIFSAFMLYDIKRIVDCYDPRYFRRKIPSYSRANL